MSTCLRHVPIERHLYPQQRYLVQFWLITFFPTQGDNPNDSANHDAQSTSSELLDMLLQEDARSGTGSNASGSGSGESGGSLGSGSGSGSNGTSTSHTGKRNTKYDCLYRIVYSCILQLDKNFSDILNTLCIVILQQDKQTHLPKKKIALRNSFTWSFDLKIPDSQNKKKSQTNVSVFNNNISQFWLITDVSVFAHSISYHSSRHKTFYF